MIRRNTLGEINKNRSDGILVRKRRDMPSSSILFLRVFEPFFAKNFRESSHISFLRKKERIKINAELTLKSYQFGIRKSKSVSDLGTHTSFLCKNGALLRTA
ncbi:hypothetical protein LEP1GSC068_3950 [Leptospira sp. Fiocruz LV3954]|nr:hypothetical protein LEP1GSC068_3950 [Leptospira sp. Fiocruz LV3954]EMI67062.1 hypothetical protein LEP1GSC076_4025 [Leptospira sp. Fiocruz LV4135]